MVPRRNPCASLGLPFGTRQPTDKAGFPKGDLKPRTPREQLDKHWSKHQNR